jgi:asparagine synthase (glutamine-hydrolysing)
MIWNRWPEALSMSSFPLSDSLKKSLSELAYMQYYDSVQYLPDDILVKVDRASMHTSLEARVPLLDHRLIELSWSIPDHMKYEKGVSKSILRKILYKYVPKELIERPKMGFGVPIDEWLRGPLKDWAWSLIEDFKDEPLFPLVKQYMDDHQKKKMNYQYSLWGILMWQQWKNYYKINHKI